jgi:cell pole-organizing protein PopZ
VGESETGADVADSADTNTLEDNDIAAEAPEDESSVTGQSVFAEERETGQDRQAERADADDHVDVSDADASEGAGPVASATVQEDTADEEATLEGAVAAGVTSTMAEVDEGAEMDRDRTDTVDLAGDEEGFLDEETLRRIVAEVVREELQGALGERITRNVRKLVRREIRLVLAADELD